MLRCFYPDLGLGVKRCTFFLFSFDLHSFGVLEIDGVDMTDLLRKHEEMRASLHFSEISEGKSSDIGLGFRRAHRQ